MFLVRDSSTSHGDYVLSVLHQDGVCHYQIRRHSDDALFSIEDDRLIHGLDALIEHYQKPPNGLSTQLSAIVKCEMPPADSLSHGSENLLHRATKGKNVIVVSEVLQSKSKLYADTKNQDGQAAVHLACMLDENTISEEILQRLIEKGVNVNCRDKDGNTPLHVGHSCLYTHKTHFNALSAFHLPPFCYCFPRSDLVCMPPTIGSCDSYAG